MIEDSSFGLTHYAGKMLTVDSSLMGEIFYPEGYNPDVKYTEWFVDDYNMMLAQNPSWRPEGDNGRGDSIGRSFRGFFTYGDERFLEGIANCWVKVERKYWISRFLFGKYYYQGYRHPAFAQGIDPQPVGLSRDHLVNTVLAFKYAGYSEEFMKEFVTHLRFKISDFALMTINLWLWLRVLAGIKGWGILYYPIEWMVMIVSSLWNRFMYWRSGFGPEQSQDEFVLIPNSMKPKSMRRMVKLFYPTYALQWQAWQIKLLPNKWWKKALQKPLWKITPRYNYVIKILLDHPDRPTKEQVEEYKSMTGGRWSGILNPWMNDRDIRIIEDQKLLEFNVLDEDYLKKLYYTISCD